MKRKRIVNQEDLEMISDALANEDLDEFMRSLTPEEWEYVAGGDDYDMFELDELEDDEEVVL